MSIKFEPLKPLSVIEYLKSKKLELSYDYDEILYQAHHKTFTVAKVTKLDLLKDLQDAVTKSIKDGTPFETFKKNIKPTLQEKGWWGLKEITNPKTGEVKEVYIGSRRLKNILTTNRQVSYTVGRYKQQSGFKNAVYLKYRALQHGNRREEHQQMHNIILHRDNPWWDINYPPNGWGCKCYVTAHTKKELDRKGWKTHTGPLENTASKDWAYHVGKTDNVKKIYKDKVNSLDNKKLKDAAKSEYKKHNAAATKTVAKKQLNEMIDEVIVKKNIKYPVNHVVVGTLTTSILTAIKKHLNKDLNEANIILHKNNLLHSKPDRKDKYNHAFSLIEMRQIIDVIDDENLCYVDNSHNNILFAFEDRIDDTKVNLIPIELTKKIKKFDKDCYVITLDKRNKKDFEADLKGGIIKKSKQ